MKECKKLLKKLAEASLPFTSGYVVDETSGTAPLMEELSDVLGKVENYLEINLPDYDEIVRSNF